MLVSEDLVGSLNEAARAAQEDEFGALGRQLARRGIDIEAMVTRAMAWTVAVPTWGVGTGGTRFARFPGKGEPRNIHDKLADCGVIQQLTRGARTVSPHIPWDKVSDYNALRQEAAQYGLGFDAVNSTTFPDQADHTLIITRTTARDACCRPTDGRTLRIVDQHSPGVGVTPIPKMGRNAVASCETTYDAVRVPVADRVGDEGDGFRYLVDGLNAERVLIAAEAIGIGRAALRAAVAYAKERVVFNRPIGQNQGIAFPLAEAHAKLRAASLMVREAALLVDAGAPCAEEANLAKYLAAEAGYFAADRAVQTLGGFGYASEYHVERYFREARLMRIAPISQELVLSYLAEHVLGLPRSY